MTKQETITVINSILRTYDYRTGSAQTGMRLFKDMVARVGRKDAGYVGHGSADYFEYHIGGDKFRIIRDIRRNKWQIDTGV